MESISIMRIELNGAWRSALLGSSVIGGEKSIPVIQTDTDSDRESGVGRPRSAGWIIQN